MRAARNAVRRVPLREQPRTGGRLLWEADALLALVPQLRATGFVSNLGQLREKLAAMLFDFQARAHRHGIERTRVEQASEVLAALIDQVVTSMPWGVESGWRSLGASGVRLGAPDGTQLPLARLLTLARASSSDVGMRELIGVALALGFDTAGRDGAMKVEELQRQIAESSNEALAVRTSPELSPHWRPSVERRSALGGWLPLWVSALIVAAALAVLYLTLELSLAARSDRVYAQLAALKSPVATTRPPLPAPQPRLAAALSKQVAARELQVRDEIDRSVIIVPGAELFEAGSAALRSGGSELLRAVATALERTPGRIEIIGHTERGEPRASRYPSDWDQSVDRARAVADTLRTSGIDPPRLSFDGHGATEPVAGGEMPGHEGRIEIVLLVGR